MLLLLDRQPPNPCRAFLDYDNRTVFKAVDDLVPGAGNPVEQPIRAVSTQAKNDDGWGRVARKCHHLAVVEVVGYDALAVRFCFRTMSTSSARVIPISAT